MSFHVRKDEAKKVVIIAVDGQLTVSNRQEMKQHALQAMESGYRKVLIDFADTGYIDSSGLGALVSVSKKIKEGNGELRLAGLNDDLRTLFELTKLDTVFTIDKAADGALAAF